jgi:hypothetical protein
MRRIATTVGMLLVIGAGIAAVVMAIVMWRDAPDDAQAAPPQPSVVYMSTDGVEANIERRLQASSAIRVQAKCPRRVVDAIGTRFSCSIRKAGTSQQIAVASVRIRGENGQFTWTSQPVKEQ